VLLKPNAFVALFACLLLVQACRPHTEASSNLTLTHEVSPQPPRVGRLTITLTLRDASEKAVTGARIAVEGNMSHAGMAPVFSSAAEIGSGRYVAPLDVAMAGDWVVLVHVILPDGKTVDRQFEIKGVAWN
jgi:YtkA-like protein